MEWIGEMRKQILDFGAGPLMEEMPRCTLKDKHIDGPTAAHRIEEIHTPLNLAYVTCTTGSSAFQNIVGITKREMPARMAAGRRALKMAGLGAGDLLLVTYPPLNNVFGGDLFDQIGMKTAFIPRPDRDALLVELCRLNPKAVIGESSFLRAALTDAGRMGIRGLLPERLIIFAAGSPMDSGMREAMGDYPGMILHDLYGCQEFGWLCMDGIPLREDITMWRNEPDAPYEQLIVGGIPTGDCFLRGKHLLNPQGTILTETRIRAEEEAEAVVEASAAASALTVKRAARTVLRIKGKIVRVAHDLECGSPVTRIRVQIPDSGRGLRITGAEKTQMWDELLEAQKDYQREAKTDPVWNKKL